MFGFGKRSGKETVTPSQESEMTDEEVKYWLIQYFLKQLHVDPRVAYDTASSYDENTFGVGDYNYNKHMPVNDEGNIDDTKVDNYRRFLDSSFQIATKDLTPEQIKQYDSLLREAYDLAIELFNEGHKANTSAKSITRRNQAIKEDAQKPEKERNSTRRRTIHVPDSVLGVKSPQEVVIVEPIPDELSTDGTVVGTGVAANSRKPDTDWRKIPAPTEKQHPIR